MGKNTYDLYFRAIKNRSDPFRQFIWTFDPFFARNIQDFAVLEVSCDKDSFSKITAVSSQFYDIFGYPKTEKIKNYDLKLLMPDFLSKKHDTFLQKYIENNQSLAINNMNLLYAKNHQGFIFPVKIFVKPSPMLDQGFISS